MESTARVKSRSWPIPACQQKSFDNALCEWDDDDDDDDVSDEMLAVMMDGLSPDLMSIYEDEAAAVDDELFLADLNWDEDDVFASANEDDDILERRRVSFYVDHYERLLREATSTILATNCMGCEERTDVEKTVHSGTCILKSLRRASNVLSSANLAEYRDLYTDFPYFPRLLVQRLKTVLN
jgi:hypothetical protein